MRDQATCPHSIERHVWVEDEESHLHQEWWNHTGRWETHTEWTTEDIDTGRYRCTQCGKVMYYTGRWRAHYEQGVPIEEA